MAHKEVVIENDSPIEEVRLTVPTTDDKTLQVLTFRTWLLGIPLCLLQTLLSEFSNYRQETYSLSPICINIVVFIAGKLMSKSLPNKVIKIPWTSWKFSLNPGPFNVKEHMVISVLTDTGGGTPGFEIASISKIFFHREIQPLPVLLLVLSIQLLGFGFAGIFMKFLVHSPYMWWPNTLVEVSFYRALHEPGERQKGELSRYQFFLIVIVATFAYTIVPGYFFPSITALSFVCWVWKDSIIAQQIGSGLHGLGLGSIALDWMTISSFFGSPLVTPAFVLFNMIAGIILLVYILVPVFYWNNAYDAKRFPLLSTNIFDADGQLYNISRIIDEKSFMFNEESYNNYSKLYFSAYLTCCYGFSFAAFTSNLSHVALFYGRSLWQQFVKAYQGGEQDVHTRLMKQNYEPIPQWWFFLILFSVVGSAIFICEGFGEQLQLRYWGILLACAVVFVFLLPQGVLQATTGSGISLGLLLEMVIGYLSPGKPIANMTFKLYGNSAFVTAIYFTSSLKTSHYMKIPPRTMFLVQVLGTILSCLFGFSIAWWMLYSIDNLCQPDLLPKGSPWTCPAEKMHLANTVTWGVVGPRKMFYPDGTYSMIFIFIFVGFLAPLPVWILSRKYPEKKWITLINWPILFGVAQTMFVATPVNFWSWCTVGIVFNYYIFNRYKEWWARYNYVLSAGLSAGVALLALLVSLSLQFSGIYGIDWWGLEVNDHCPLAQCPTTPGVVVEGCPVIN